MKFSQTEVTVDQTQVQAQAKTFGRAVAEQPSLSISQAKPPIVVEIAGQVNQPGVYQLSAQSRISQLVVEAQGFTNQVDKVFVSQVLNQAQVLTDGQKLYVPATQERLKLVKTVDSWEQLQEKLKQLAGLKAGEEKTTTKQNQTTAATNSNNEELVSINTAGTEQLQELPGIGEKRAKEIVQNRPFSKLEQLLDLKIVPESVYNEIKASISL